MNVIENQVRKIEKEVRKDNRMSHLFRLQFNITVITRPCASSMIYLY